MLIVTSLVSGVFFGRLFSGVATPLNFTIPAGVLGQLGVSAGSAVVTTATKAAQDVREPERVSVSDQDHDQPRWAQIFLQESGAYADRVIDASKFQNFLFTLVLAVAYVALAISTIAAPDAHSVTSLPELPASFLALLGISHAAYAAGKLTPADGTAPGMTVANRNLVISGALSLDPPRNKPSAKHGGVPACRAPPVKPAGAGPGVESNTEGGRIT